MVKAEEEALVSSQQRLVDDFTGFCTAHEPRLRHALIATCGPEIGREATADALEYGWAHWDRISVMDYPVAYLYRVGRSCAKKYRKRQGLADAPAAVAAHWVEPKLIPALQRLSRRQRTAVVLIHSFDWTHAEVAALLGVTIPTVQKHVARGLAKLRRALEDSP